MISKQSIQEKITDCTYKIDYFTEHDNPLQAEHFRGMKEGLEYGLKLFEESEESNPDMVAVHTSGGVKGIDGNLFSLRDANTIEKEVKKAAKVK